MASNIPVIVQGNSFSLAIPLQIYYINGEQMDLEDYTPDPTDEVSVQLKGSRRNYTYTPTIDGNVANIDLSGNELADNYSVVVSIVKANGQRLRSFRTDQFFIVESSDDLTTDDIIQGLEENVIYLNTQCFVAGADGRGITSIVKTSTTGLVDTYTITYSDNTTSTFQVTNGAAGQQGADGVGITSIEKTATVGLVDTYTITLSNGQTSTFDVTNGRDGVDLGLATIVDNLTEGGSTNVLSAEMGKVLGEDIDALKGIETYVRDAELDTDGKYYYTNGNYWSKDGVSTSRNILVKAGQTINVTLATHQANTLAIAVLRANGNCNPSISVPYVSGVRDYSFTAQEDTNVRICYKTSDGFTATIDQGNPTAKVDAKVETILSRLGGTVIPFDQPKTYTFVNGSLVENTGSLTTSCSTAKLNIADYKAIFYSGWRNTYNGYFAALFFDDDDNFVSWGLMTYLSTQETPAVGRIKYNMVNVLEDVPEGATKVVLQTTKDGSGASYSHKVIAFADVPYNFLHDLNWRQDYYGVKGDGTTDDSAALQLLIENSRGEVTLRAGTYLVENPLVINTMKLRKFNGNGATIKVSGDITAFELQGSCTDDAGPTAQGEFRVSHAGFIFENVTITSDDGTEGTAIYIGNCLKPSILNCYIYHINNGIVMNSTCRDINIIGNNIYQCNSYGILLDTNASLHQLNVSANHISYCKYCFYINDSRQINNFQLTGNDLEVASGSPAGSDNSCIRIIGDTNTILLGEIEIVGNTIQGHSGSSHAIYIHGGSVVAKNAYGITITGNFISGVMGYDNGEGNAIFLANARNIVISGNNCKGVKTSFVKLGVNATYVTINGNAVMDYDRTFAMITTASDATISGLCVCGNVGRNSNIAINGASQDYVSIVGNNLGGGTVTIGTATHKQEANNI